MNNENIEIEVYVIRQSMIYIVIVVCATEHILLLFQEIQKKYRTVLNNITPNNVVLMVKNIISLPIKTDDCLKGVVELLFHKVFKKNLY